MPTRRPYPSDLSDAHWESVEPVLSAWRFERRGRALDFGRPPGHDLRDIMDAILYVDRTGVQSIHARPVPVKSADRVQLREQDPMQPVEDHCAPHAPG